MEKKLENKNDPDIFLTKKDFNQNKNKTLAIIIGLSVIIITLGGYVGYKYFETNKEEEKNISNKDTPFQERTSPSEQIGQRGNRPQGGSRIELPDTYEEFFNSNEEEYARLKEMITSEENFDLMKEMETAREEGNTERAREIMNELGFSKPSMQ